MVRVCRAVHELELVCHDGQACLCERVVHLRVGIELEHLGAGLTQQFGTVAVGHVKAVSVECLQTAVHEQPNHAKLPWFDKEYSLQDGPSIELLATIFGVEADSFSVLSLYLVASGEMA